MTDLISYLLYLCVALLVAVLSLPLVIALQARQGRESELDLLIDVALLGGLVGIRISRPTHSWLLQLTFARCGLPWPTVVKRIPSGAAVATATDAAEAKPDGVETVDTTPAESEPVLVKVRKLRSRVLAAAHLFARPTVELIKSISGAFSIRRLSLDGRAGFDDPALTGQLYGAVGTLSRALPRRVRIDVTPDFVDSTVSGRAALVVHLHLGYILLLCLRFCASVAKRWLWSKIPSVSGGSLSGLLGLSGR